MKDIRTEIIEKLIKEKSPNKKAFAESIDMPYTTLRSMLERGIGNASIDNVLKVCKGLNITADELERMAKGENIDNIGMGVESSVPYLTSKDERDIQKELQKMIDGLDSKSGYAAFDGGTLEGMDEEDRELLIASLENSLRLAKRLAKQKFTPNKYRE